MRPNDRAILAATVKQLIERFGRNEVLAEVKRARPKSPGRPKFIRKGEDIWLACMLEERRLMKHGRATNMTEVSAIVAANMQRSSAAGIAAKTIANLVADVEGRRDGDPKYRQQLDMMLAEVEAAVKIFGPGEFALPGRLKQSK
jgi:hypothetical protein